MKSFFRELFEYNLESNLKVKKILTQEGFVCSDYSIKLLNHLLNAHQIWNSRIERTIESFKVWEIHAPEKYEAIIYENHTLSMQILEKYDLKQSIKYYNSKNECFTNTIRDILFHVINHSNYHRAQIAADIKTSGGMPAITDFIFYKRELPQ